MLVPWLGWLSPTTKGNWLAAAPWGWASPSRKPRRPSGVPLGTSCPKLKLFKNQNRIFEDLYHSGKHVWVTPPGEAPWVAEILTESKGDRCKIGRWRRNTENNYDLITDYENGDCSSFVYFLLVICIFCVYTLDTSFFTFLFSI